MGRHTVKVGPPRRQHVTPECFKNVGGAGTVVLEGVPAAALAKGIGRWCLPWLSPREALIIVFEYY